MKTFPVKNWQKMAYDDKKPILVLSEGLSYLSQNSTFKSKNLAIYLKQFALQNETTFRRKKVRIEQPRSWLSCSDS